MTDRLNAAVDALAALSTEDRAKLFSAVGPPPPRDQQTLRVPDESTRLSRADYAVALLGAIVFVVFAGCMLPPTTLVQNEVVLSVPTVFGAFLYLAAAVTFIVAPMRRAHDCGWPGIVGVLCSIVPVGSLLLIFWPSMQGPNRYGVEPGTTLTEAKPAVTVEPAAAVAVTSRNRARITLVALVALVALVCAAIAWR